MPSWDAIAKLGALTIIGTLIAAMTMAVITGAGTPTADQRYGCTVQQQAPNGEGK